LICEGTERITAALKAGKMIDVLPAEALFGVWKYIAERVPP